jgi:hypothetical protein
MAEAQIGMTGIHSFFNSTVLFFIADAIRSSALRLSAFRPDAFAGSDPFFSAVAFSKNPMTSTMAQKPLSFKWFVL